MKVCVDYIGNSPFNGEFVFKNAYDFYYPHYPNKSSLLTLFDSSGPGGGPPEFRGVTDEELNFLGCMFFINSFIDDDTDESSTDFKIFKTWFNYIHTSWSIWHEYYSLRINCGSIGSIFDDVSDCGELFRFNQYHELEDVASNYYFNSWDFKRYSLQIVITETQWIAKDFILSDNGICGLIPILGFFNEDNYPKVNLYFSSLNEIPTSIDGIYLIYNCIFDSSLIRHRDFYGNRWLIYPDSRAKILSSNLVGGFNLSEGNLYLFSLADYKIGKFDSYLVDGSRPNIDVLNFWQNGDVSSPVNHDINAFGHNFGFYLVKIGNINGSGDNMTDSQLQRLLEALGSISDNVNCVCDKLTNSCNKSIADSFSEAFNRADCLGSVFKKSDSKPIVDLFANTFLLDGEGDSVFINDCGFGLARTLSTAFLQNGCYDSVFKSNDEGDGTVWGRLDVINEDIIALQHSLENLFTNDCDLTFGEMFKEVFMTREDGCGGSVFKVSDMNNPSREFLMDFLFKQLDYIYNKNNLTDYNWFWEKSNSRAKSLPNLLYWALFKRNLPTTGNSFKESVFNLADGISISDLIRRSLFVGSNLFEANLNDGVFNSFNKNNKLLWLDCSNNPPSLKFCDSLPNVNINSMPNINVSSIPNVNVDVSDIPDITVNNCLPSFDIIVPPQVNQINIESDNFAYVGKARYSQSDS